MDKASRLEHWLADLVALPERQREGFGEVFKLHRTQANVRYSVQCCPMAPEGPLILGEGAHHIVFVTAPRKVDMPAQADLQAQLGLTPAECRVTNGLVQGATYSEAACKLGSVRGPFTPMSSLSTRRRAPTTRPA